MWVKGDADEGCICVVITCTSSQYLRVIVQAACKLNFSQSPTKTKLKQPFWITKAAPRKQMTYFTAWLGRNSAAMKIGTRPGIGPGVTSKIAARTLIANLWFGEHPDVSGYLCRSRGTGRGEATEHLCRDPRCRGTLCLMGPAGGVSGEVRRSSSVSASLPLAEPTCSYCPIRCATCLCGVAVVKPSSDKLQSVHTVLEVALLPAGTPCTDGGQQQGLAWRPLY